MTTEDILHNEHLVKASARFVLDKYQQISAPEDFDLRFHKVGDDRYRVDTNLTEKLSISTDTLHDTLKAALLGVAGVNQCIGDMKAHTALSGFTDEEFPLFRTKLDSLVDVHGSKNQERRFQRLITVGGLPEISADSQIDIEKLLKIREEPEFLELRSWLTNLDKYDDAELKRQLNGFNTKLGLNVQSTIGKSIRFLVTTMAGLASAPLGIVLSALDQFLWDKVAHRSGVAAFAHELYPSIFKSQ